jgi:hypothetical protein
MFFATVGSELFWQTHMTRLSNSRNEPMWSFTRRLGVIAWTIAICQSGTACDEEDYCEKAVEAQKKWVYECEGPEAADYLDYNEEAECPAEWKEQLECVAACWDTPCDTPAAEFNGCIDSCAP